MHQQEIREIVKRMTLEEKASLCSGKDFWHLEGFEQHEEKSAVRA